MATNVPILLPIPPPRTVAPGECTVPTGVPIQTICLFNSFFFVTFPLGPEHFYILHLALADRDRPSEHIGNQKQAWIITNAFLGRNIVKGFTKAPPPKLYDLRIDFIFGDGDLDNEIPRHVQLVRVQRPSHQEATTTQDPKPRSAKSLRELVLYNMRTRGELQALHAANERFITKRDKPSGEDLDDGSATASSWNAISPMMDGEFFVDAEESLLEILCGVPVLMYDDWQQWYNPATPVMTPSLTRCASPTSTSTSSPSTATVAERGCPYHVTHECANAESFDVEDLPSFYKRVGGPAVKIRRRHSFDERALSRRPTGVVDLDFDWANSA